MLTLYFALFTLQLFQILYIIVARRAIKPKLLVALVSFISLLATGRPPSLSPGTVQL